MSNRTITFDRDEATREVATARAAGHEAWYQPSSEDDTVPEDDAFVVYYDGGDPIS